MVYMTLIKQRSCKWCRGVVVTSKGYPEISLTNGENKSEIYDGTSPLLTLYLKCSFCWCLLTDRFVQPHSLYNLTSDTDQVSPVSIRAVSFCIFCKVLKVLVYAVIPY